MRGNVVVGEKMRRSGRRGMKRGPGEVLAGVPLAGRDGQ